MMVLRASFQPIHTNAQQAQTPAPALVTASAVTVTTGITTQTPVSVDTPTPGVTVVTSTPEPLDILAAATQSIQLTEQAAREGTPTLPRQPTMLSLLLRWPLPSLTPFIITPTPRAADVFEAATRKAEQEAKAVRGETLTPLPDNVVVATVTPAPRVVTNTPTAANNATVTADAIQATAIAYTTGVPNVVTATPTGASSSGQATHPAEVTVDHEVFVRNGPNANFTMVDSLPAGAVVEISGCNADCSWLEIGPAVWIEASQVTPQR